MIKPDYTHSIVNMTSSLMKHYELDPYHNTLKTLDNALDKHYNHVIMLILDGMGLHVMNKHLQKDGLFRTHLADTLTSVFPATTVAATTAILTGKTPYETGHIGWFQYFKDYDIHYTVFLKQDFYDAKKAVPIEVPQRFEHQTIVDVLSVSRPDINANIFFPKPVDKNGHQTLSDGFKRAMTSITDHHKTFNYLYLTEPDFTMHAHGTDTEILKQVLIKLERDVETFVKKMPEKTLLIISADHGMKRVEPFFIFEDKLLCETFLHKPAFEPRATTFFIKPHKMRAFERHFKAHYGRYFELFTKDNLLAKKLLGSGVKHPLIEECLGDYMAIAKDKYYFEFANIQTHKGHHAGLTPEEMWVPLLLFEERI